MNWREWMSVSLIVLIVLGLTGGLVFFCVKMDMRSMRLKYENPPGRHLITECGEKIPVYRYRTFGGGLFGSDTMIEIWTTGGERLIISGSFKLTSSP